MKIFGAYVHVRPDGRIFWVGKGTRERAEFPYRNDWHDKIVKKYGWENIKIRFYACASEEAALTREKKLIANYRKKGIVLTNLTEGGEGTTFTEEGRAILRKALSRKSYKVKKTKVMKALWRKKEYREKLIKSAREKIFSEEHRKNISKAFKKPRAQKRLRRQLKERWKNEKYRKKILKVLKKANTGRIIPKEQRIKMSAVQKKVMQDPRMRKQISNSVKKFFRKNPLAKAKLTKRLTVLSRKRSSEHSKIMKQIWRDPERRKIMMRRYRKA